MARMPSPSPERLEREISALADAGLDAETLKRALLDRLLTAVPAHAACIASADPVSLALVAHTTVGIDRRGADRLYEAEYGATPDFGSHRQLAAGEPVRVLSEATRGDVERSARYRELLAPAGWRHELRAAASERGATWGFVHLYREVGTPDFSADEAALVARVTPHLARGLRAGVLRGGGAVGEVTAVPASRAPAMWVLDERCRLVQSTPGSEATLAALRDDGVDADAVPEVLVGLAVMARSLAGRGDVARIQVPTADGDWLTLHASPLVAADGTAGQVAIMGQPAQAAELQALTLLAYRLTPAERRTVELVLAGRSTKQIAEELVLSPHTVQDRMQDVFAKVGVRSRRELVATLAG